MAGLCRCPSCFSLICWEGQGQERQVVMRICLPSMTTTLRYWSLLPKRTGDLVSDSLLLLVQGYKHIADTFFDLESFSRPSLPLCFRWRAHLAFAVHLFLDLPFLHISFNKWFLWIPHLVLVLGLSPRCLPIYCILSILAHIPYTVSSNIYPHLSQAPDTAPEPR